MSTTIFHCLLKDVSLTQHNKIYRSYTIHNIIELNVLNISIFLQKYTNAVQLRDIMHYKKKKNRQRPFSVNFHNGNIYKKKKNVSLKTLIMIHNYINANKLYCTERNLDMV